MNRRYFPLAAPARMSAQQAAAATPPAIAAAPARAAAVPARAAALAVRGGGAGRRGGGSSGMVVVEAARRGKQLGEVHSFTLLQEQLHSVLGTLSEREAGVVSMRFGLTDGQPKTLGEIGKVYGSPGSGSGRSSPRRC